MHARITPINGRSSNGTNSTPADGRTARPAGGARINGQFANPAKLTPQERRLVLRLVNADPDTLRRLRHDPRLDRTTARLLEAYRAELIEGLERHLEAGLRRAKRAKLPPLGHRIEEWLARRPVPA